MARSIPFLLCLCFLLRPAHGAAQEQESDTPCCHAVAVGMPVAAAAVAVETAGDKPLWLLPDDPSTLDFDLEGVCIEQLINGLLKAGRLRAMDCGRSFGLFGPEITAARASCDAVRAPVAELPPGTLDGWSLVAVLTQLHGERLAVLSTDDGRSHLVGNGATLASEGASVAGVGDRAILVARGGVGTLDGTLAPLAVLHLGEPPAPTCKAISGGAEGAASSEEAGGDATEDPEEAGDNAEGAPEGEEGDAEGDPEGAEGDAEGGATSAEGDAEAVIPADQVIYECEGWAPDFIQRPLPLDLVDDPALAGQEVTITVDFNDEGWTRRVVSMQAAGLDDAAVATLAASVADWRIIPLEVEPGTLAWVRATITFTLDVPCR